MVDIHGRSTAAGGEDDGRAGRHATKASNAAPTTQQGTGGAGGVDGAIGRRRRWLPWSGQAAPWLSRDEHDEDGATL
ncbi:hypothetical protein Dimus_036080, partial [Dionaea muscipula]